MNIETEEKKAQIEEVKSDTNQIKPDRYKGLAEYRKKCLEIKKKRKEQKNAVVSSVTKGIKKNFDKSKTSKAAGTGSECSSLDSSFEVDSNDATQQQQSSQVPGITKKIKKGYRRDPNWNKVLKVISITPPSRLEYTDETITPIDEIITNKLYKITIKWLGGDHQIHKKDVTFGQRPKTIYGGDGTTAVGKKYPDFIGHGDEAQRCRTQCKFKGTGYSPLEPNFYRMYLLNNKPTLDESFKNMKETILAKAYQYVE